MKLERLCLPTVASSNLCYIPQLRHLHTLQLHVSTVSRGQEVVDFYAALIASPLPLRHLRLAHDAVLNEGTAVDWASRLFTSLPTFISVYAGRLLTLGLLQSRTSFIDSSPAEVAEAMTAALLSCHGLRRLEVSDWWLSSDVPRSSSPAFPDLESLELYMESDACEDNLALLLDAAPHLQELHLRAHRLPCDVLLWVGQRCHELRTLEMSARRRGDFSNLPQPVFPLVATKWPLMDLDALDHQRWRSLSATALPQLTSLLYGVPLSPNTPSDGLTGEEHHPLVVFFTRFASYVVHSAPALRSLRFPIVEVDGYRVPLSLLSGLRHLRRLSLGQHGHQWMHRGALEKCWTRRAQEGSRVQRGPTAREDSLWGREVLPRPRLPWRQTEEPELMRGGMRPEVEVVEAVAGEWQPSMFREEVDGMTGAAAFFTTVHSQSLTSVASRTRSRPRRGRGEAEDSDDSMLGEERIEKAEPFVVSLVDG